jgi:hypothetical protein
VEYILVRGKRGGGERGGDSMREGGGGTVLMGVSFSTFVFHLAH